MKSIMRIIILVLFALVACEAAIILRSHHSKDTERMSFQEVRVRAENGSARDQYYLGSMYATGQVIPQDYSKAFQWYHKAAEQGDSMGENGLGFLYFNGRGLPQNYTEALLWYRKAAELNNSKSQYNIGNMYYYGKGVQQDRAEAERWYSRAADQTDEDAQRVLGIRWMGRDIGSRVVLPIDSLITVLFLISIYRGQNLLDGQYRALTLTAFIGIAYLVCFVYWLPHTRVIHSLLVDHASYLRLNIILGMYVVQIFSLIWPTNAKSKGARVALSIALIVFIGFNLYMSVHSDLLSASWALRLLCLTDGLLIGILTPLVIFLMGALHERKSKINA